MSPSIWEKQSFFAPQDIIIAGSGFTGLWSAFYLKKKWPGLSVTILDRGYIPTGASTRNAGFACFGSLGEVVHDAQIMGTEKMLELVEMRAKGLERICKYFSSSEIDFDPCGGYELYDSESQVSPVQLLHNIDYINSLFKPVTGTKKTYELADEDIMKFGFGRTAHLVKNKLEGALHSGKLVQKLLQRVQGMGVQVFSQAEVIQFYEDGDRLQIKTNLPVPFSTRQLLICTNAFAKQLLPETDVIPARGQVLVTSPIEGLPFKGTFHSDEGFYYFRNLGNRVLLGGARNKAFAEEETIEMNTSDQIQNFLEQYLDEVVIPQFKGYYSIDYRWAGIMGMGSEKMPVAREIRPNVFCAVRMSGMGVALAPVVARNITKQMVAQL